MRPGLVAGVFGAATWWAGFIEHRDVVFWGSYGVRIVFRLYPTIIVIVATALPATLVGLLLLQGGDPALEHKET